MPEVKKDSFLLYTEQLELIEQLSNEQAGELFKNIFYYVASGEVKNLDPMTKLVFTSVRQDLDRNMQKYEEIVEKRRLAGAKGGKQKALNAKIAEAEEIFEEQNLVEENFVENDLAENLANAKFAKKLSSKSSYYDNVNEHVNEHVNENENVNVNENVSLSKEREGEFEGEREKNSKISGNKISPEDRKLLEKYVREKKYATKNADAYVSKIIQNGDYAILLEKAKQKIDRKKREEEEFLERMRKRKEIQENMVFGLEIGEDGKFRVKESILRAEKEKEERERAEKEREMEREKRGKSIPTAPE